MIWLCTPQEDLMSLKVNNEVHHLSIKRGIQILRLNSFNPNCLQRRPKPEDVSRDEGRWGVENSGAAAINVINLIFIEQLQHWHALHPLGQRESDGVAQRHRAQHVPGGVQALGQEWRASAQGESTRVGEGASSYLACTPTVTHLEWIIHRLVFFLNQLFVAFHSLTHWHVVASPGISSKILRIVCP